MNDTPRRAERPLVVALCSVPLLQEGLDVALGDVTDLHTFPVNGGDTLGLLRDLRPDALVVDDSVDAATLLPFADESQLPVLHISLRDRTLRILRNGSWEVAGNGGASPEDVRNMLIASLLAGGRGREHR